MALICITTASITSYGRGAARDWRRLPAVVLFQTMPCSLWLRNLKAWSWERWMKTSRSRAWPGRSCYWGTRRGGFGALKANRRASWWKARTVLRPGFRSGVEKLRRARPSFQRSWVSCEKKSATACPAWFR